MQTGLMPAHRTFIKHLLSGKPINRAGTLAGFGHQTGYDLMKNPAIQNELARQMEKAGITDQYLAKKVKQGLNARTVPQKDGGTRYDDQFVRRQWADLAIKVKGGYAPEKIESEHKVIQIVIDSNMLGALKDARAISDVELVDIQALEHTPIEPNEEEILDAEITETDDNTGDIGCIEAQESGRSDEESKGNLQQVPGEESGTNGDSGARETGEGGEEGNSGNAEARGEEVSGKDRQVEGND